MRADSQVFWRPREARNEAYRLGGGVIISVHATCIRLRNIVFYVGRLVFLLAADKATEKRDTFSAVARIFTVSKSVVLARWSHAPFKKN